MSKEQKQTISFRATKILSKPASISFHTKDGKEVRLRRRKDLPKSAKTEFFRKGK